MSGEQRDTQAFDRVTRLLDAAVKTIEAHPEYSGERVVLFLTPRETGKRAGLVTHGYDDDIEAVADLFEHLRAIFRANGKELLLAPLGKDS